MKRIRRIVNNEHVPYYVLEVKPWWFWHWTVINERYKLSQIAVDYMNHSKGR